MPSQWPLHVVHEMVNNKKRMQLQRPLFFFKYINDHSIIIKLVLVVCFFLCVSPIYHDHYVSVDFVHYNLTGKIVVVVVVVFFRSDIITAYRNVSFVDTHTYTYDRYFFRCVCACVWV